MNTDAEVPAQQPCVRTRCATRAGEQHRSLLIPNCARQATLVIDMLHHHDNYSIHVYLSPYRPSKDTGLDCLLQLPGGQ